MRTLRLSLGMRWLVLLACALLAACASTTVDGTWTRPEFAGTRLQGLVMVVGVARDDTVRRIYEDDMVAKLEARGVKALRSYEALPGTLHADGSDALQEAARKAGAAYLLSTAVIGQQRETVVTPDPFLYGGWPGWRGWYRSYWGLSYPVRAEVRTYDTYLAQTALTEVASDRVQWTARTRTTAPTDIERETRAFVDVLLGAMARAGLVTAAAR